MKKVWMIPAAVPLLWEVPYWIQAWRTSPLDRWDWIFLLSACILLGFTASSLKRIPSEKKWFWIGVPLVALFCYAVGAERQIHALKIISGIFLLWSTVLALYGWTRALFVLPVFGMLLLAVPGTRYWLGFFTGQEGLSVKACAGILLLFWAYWTCYLRRRVSLRFLTGAAAVVILFFIFSGEESFQAYPPLKTVFKSGERGVYLGREEEPSERDRRFFEGSEVKRYYFAGDGDARIGVLTVWNFENVHKVHPAGHCLRAGGEHILSDGMFEANINGVNRQFNEIRSAVPGGERLTWAWYGNDLESSGSFLFFRRHYSKTGNWRTCQISTFAGDVACGRKILADFLNTYSEL